MKKYLFVLLAAFAAACTVVEPVETVVAVDPDAPVFYATIEGADAAVPTRAYVDDQLRVLWDANDHVSIFNKYTYNLEYKFDGKTGDNAGTFTQVPHEFFVAGNELPLVYAVYPYKEGTTITNDGAISYELPAVQSQLAGSFGIGDNTMVSVTEDNNLLFKNLCGYFGLKLYGKGSVQSITLKGNNDEPLAGVATINGAVGEVPTLTFGYDATKEITVNLPSPVTVGETQETATLFWIVVPPTEFTKGITVVVKGEDKTTTKVIDKPLTITRNILTEGGFEIDIEHVNAKPMFAKFNDMVIRVGQNYTNQGVWYGTVDAYNDRDDVEGATWTSSNEAVVAAEPGSIKGIAPGKATVKIADAENNYLVIPVEVLPAANKDYDYNYGIELISNKAIRGEGETYGFVGNGTMFLGPGYADGTECYHVKDLHREDANGNKKTVYLVSQAKFEPVDITAIEHPALYLRLYVKDASLLHMDGAAAQIELSSNGADSEEYTWVGGRVCKNWPGQHADCKFEIKDGWNNIVLPLEYAELSAGTPRPAKINWFRMYHNPSAEFDMTGKDQEFAIDQLRIVDWTEFDTCDNFDQWFDGGTGNNRPCFRAAENLDGHAKVFGSVNELITGPISNFRIKEWAGRVYALPVNMDSSNAKFSWWLWVDDAAFFNKCHIKGELSSENVNDQHNWAWGYNPGDLNLQNGWNEIKGDFAAAQDQSGAATKRSDRKINYFRIVVTPMGDAQPGFHTYYIDDLRVSKK